jgi:hypothetical protein
MHRQRGSNEITEEEGGTATVAVNPKDSFNIMTFTNCYLQLLLLLWSAGHNSPKPA